jgi:hypothetical protein
VKSIKAGNVCFHIKISDLEINDILSICHTTCVHYLECPLSPKTKIQQFIGYRCCYEILHNLRDMLNSLLYYNLIILHKKLTRHDTSRFLTRHSNEICHSIDMILLLLRSERVPQGRRRIFYCALQIPCLYR